MQYFKDRKEAAILLSERLVEFRGRQPLLLGIPRGGAPMAHWIGGRLEGDVDVVLARKMSAPGNPELAVAAVDESGRAFMSGYARATRDYLETERHKQVAVMRERRTLYSRVRKPVDPTGRIAIVVDDGLATGATMISALQATRQRHPALLVCAVPVSPPQTLDRVRAFADRMICLHSPPEFSAVGQFYWEFPQVSDAEVVEILRRSTGRW